MSEDIKNSAATEAAMGKDGGDGRAKGKRRRKVSYLTINKIDKVDYKDIAVLKRFLNDRGKISPARQSGNTAGQQRMITRAIDRARELALLPFVVTEAVDNKPVGGYRRDRGDRGDRGGYDRGGYDRGGDKGGERSERKEPTAEASAPAAAAPAPAAE